ncbi:MAG: toxin-antitoxin system HicB family antitoxin [Chloroflexi bacterium]|nr:toxin-antitoxin system HicB family antitoxin [Chloroflexota bacterium]
MTTKSSDYLTKPYSRILIPDDTGTYAAEILEFPGCFAEGTTPDEAMRHLEEAAESWIEVCLERGLDIPEPAMNQGYNGKIALRLPRSLHRQAARMAERDGTSLNQFLVTAIAARLGAEDFYTRLVERFEFRMATTAANMVLSMKIPQFRKSSVPLLDTIVLPSSSVFGEGSTAYKAQAEVM